MQASPSEHVCSGECAALRRFLVSLTHDLVGLLRQRNVVDAERLLHGFILCLMTGAPARVTPSVIDNRAIFLALEAVAISVRGARVVPRHQSDITVNSDMRFLELAFWAMIAEASSNRYAGTEIELRCDRVANEVWVTVEYSGCSAAEAALLPVPHLNVILTNSSHRSDVAIKLQIASIAAAANHGRIELTELQGMQAIRLLLPAMYKE